MHRLPAIVLAAAVVLPLSGRPAQAAVDPNTLIAVGKQLVSLWKDLKGGKDLEKSTAEIIAAIEAAKTAIISHADALAAAQAKACTNHAVIEVADITAFTPQTLQRWAQDATGCVTLIDSLITTVADKKVANELGLVANIVGPIALLARQRAGLSTAAINNVLAGSNRSILSRLEPACQKQGNPLWWEESGDETWYFEARCVGYRETTFKSVLVHRPWGAPEPTNPIDVAPMRAQLVQSSSYVVALAVLPYYAA